MAAFVDEKLKASIRSFNERGQLGPDPLAARYAERRAGYSLFARMMSDATSDVLVHRRNDRLLIARHAESGGHSDAERRRTHGERVEGCVLERVAAREYHRVDGDGTHGWIA